MTFKVVPLEHKDSTEWCHIHYAAFSPWLGCLWHHPPTEANVTEMARQRALGLDDPHQHIFKAVDVSTGQIAGVASWKVYPEERSREQLEQSLVELPYTSDINADARREFMGGIHNSRRHNLGTQPCVLLGSLVVRPEYQRQGVGRLLMEWGVAKADELGLIAYLEASVNGLELYKQFGFHPHSLVLFDTSKYGGGGVDTHTVMFREPAAKQ